MTSSTAPYRYHGPLSGVTLADGREVMLFDGATVDLPPAHPYVKSLVAQRRLEPVTTSLPPAAPTTKLAKAGAKERS